MSKDNCKSKILFFSPQMNNGKVANPKLTEIGIQKKINAKAGDTVLIESKLYGGNFTVSDVWNPSDDSGQVILINHPYGNTGEKDKAGLPIDTKSGGWISICSDDMSAGKIDKTQSTDTNESSFDTTQTEKSSGQGKRKMNWWIVLGIIILIILVIWFFNRKKAQAGGMDNLVP